MIDLPACEWRPASNRSIVDPVAAVARLDMPPPVRAVLVDKLRRHAFDDVVSITWATITSNSGQHQYAAAISNMNFARGRLCRSVTRSTWTVEQTEGALVYIVGDRAFGYAAACGNLFELTRLEPPIAERQVPGADAPGATTAVGVLDAPPERSAFTAPVEAPAGPLDTFTMAPALGMVYPPFSYGPIFYAPPVFNPPCCALPPVPAVAEPETYLLILAGLALIAAVRPGRRA